MPLRIGYQVRDVTQEDLSKEARLALEHLQSWYEDGSPMRLEVPGAALAMEINTQFRFVNTELAFIYGGGDSGLSHFLKTVSKRLDANPKAEITELERTYVDQLLADAWSSAVSKYGRDPQQWSDVARKQVTARTLSYYGSLDGFPSLSSTHDLPLPPLSCVDGATVFSQAAQAYVQWVPLANVDEARSLLPPGSAESPENVMRTANVEGWVRGELHPAPLSRMAVERIATTRRTLTPSAPITAQD